MKKNIFKAIICFIVFYYGRYLQLIPIYLFSLKNTITNNLFLSIYSYTLEFLFFIWFFRKDLKDEFIKFKDNFNSNIDIGIKYWLLGTILMMISNIAISIFFTGNGPTNEKLVQEMIHAIPWVMLINTALLGPFVEEITFRKGFRLLIKNKYAFVLISGIVFGALHVILSFSSVSELLYIIPYSIVGISYSLMYAETDTIFTSFSMHMLHNGILTILSFI